MSEFNDRPVRTDQMTPLEYWTMVAEAVVVQAECDGVIITIERVPTPGRPLAMREHIAHIETRLAR